MHLAYLRELVFPNGQSRIQTTRVIVALSIAPTMRVLTGMNLAPANSAGAGTRARIAVAHGCNPPAGNLLEPGTLRDWKELLAATSRCATRATLRNITWL